MNLEELEDIGLFLVGLFQPEESLIVVFETQIGVYERTRGNVARLAAFAQFTEQVWDLRNLPN